VQTTVSSGWIWTQTIGNYFLPAKAAPSYGIREALLEPILKHVRYVHMSVEKLKQLTNSDLVPNNLIFEALFYKLNRSESANEDLSLAPKTQRPRLGSRLFLWVPTAKVTVSGDFNESAMHTSANGFTGVRGDRRMQQGVYSWTVEIVETQSSWIFVGVAHSSGLGLQGKTSRHLTVRLQYREAFETSNGWRLL
jgi:hypothetical protein